MANTSISQLVALSSANANDLFVVVDVLDTTMAPSGTDKKMSFSQLSLVIDAAIGNTQGNILYRGSSSWSVLAPGTPGNFLQTQGAAANPQWAQSGSGSVNSGTLNQVAYYPGAGNTISGESLTTLIDTVIGNVQGDILYRSVSAWSALAPGTNGQFLQTQGASSNPRWADSAGGGTVNSATIGQVAYYASTGSAVSGEPLTTLIDSIDNTQGDILYRNASTWVALAPGTNGQFLQTLGAAANPQWANAAGSGTVNSATSGNVAYYAGTGTTVSGESLSALLDSSIGSTQGNILYRSASAWSVLAVGQAGQFLQTQGASANPKWASSTGVYEPTFFGAL